MPLGLGIGIIVVVLFEAHVTGWTVKDRIPLFRTLSKMDKAEAIPPAVDRMLLQWIDGPVNIFRFWTGGALSLTNKLDKDHYTKAFEILAVCSALLLSICVTFYVEGGGDECHLYGLDMCHVYGLVCCVSNCALWMATLSSAFFTVVLNSCKDDEQLELLLSLYGRYLMCVPMMLFVWGSILLFLEFIMYFKLHVDPGINCSACLGSCLVLYPLWLHCMHKMGWVAAVVHEEAKEREQAPQIVPTFEELEKAFQDYVDSAQGNCLALDHEEFLTFLQKPGTKITSVQRIFATRLLDSHVEAELRKRFHMRNGNEDHVSRGESDISVDNFLHASLQNLTHGQRTCQEFGFDNEKNHSSHNNKNSLLSPSLQPGLIAFH